MSMMGDTVDQQPLAAGTTMTDDANNQQPSLNDDIDDIDDIDDSLLLRTIVEGQLGYRVRSVFVYVIDVSGKIKRIWVDGVELDRGGVWAWTCVNNVGSLTHIPSGMTVKRYINFREASDAVGKVCNWKVASEVWNTRDPLDLPTSIRIGLLEILYPSKWCSEVSVCP